MEYIDSNEGSNIVPVSGNRSEYKEYSRLTYGRNSSFIYPRKGKKDVVE